MRRSSARAYKRAIEGGLEGGRQSRGDGDGDGDSGGGDGKGWERRGIAREEEVSRGRKGGHLLAAGVDIRSAPTTRVRKILRERRDGERERRSREGGRWRSSGEDRGSERGREGGGRRKKK